MKILIQEQNKTRSVNSTAICWFEASGNSTIVILAGGKKIVSTKTLKHYDELLDGKGFCRIHDKYLINLDYVDSHSRGRMIAVTMQCKTALPVSARKKTDYLQAVNEK